MDKKRLNNWKKYGIKDCLSATKKSAGKKKILGILIIVSVIMIAGSFHILSFANEIDQAKDEKTNLEKRKE